MQPDRIGVSDMLLGTVWEVFAAWWWLIALVVALGILREVAFGKRPCRKWKRRGGYSNAAGRFQSDSVRSDSSRLGDPKAQMEFISRVDFEPRCLLNKSEYGILRILEKTARETGRGHRVMAQTSLGEIIAPRTASGSE